GDPLNITGIYTAYQDLAHFLRDTGGYTNNVNLFSYGFDWRFDLAGQATQLCDFLGKKFFRVDSPTPADKIDIVAHSMGGLLVRAYLQGCSDAHRIASVIYLGTPQRGAPLSYAKLIGAASLMNKAINGQFGTLNWRLNLETETFLVQNFP